MLGVKPSFMTGFAQHAGESKYPELWQGLVGVWAPGLGPTGSQLFDFSKNSNIGVISGLEPDDYGVGVYGFGIYGAQGTPFYFVPSKQGYALYMDGTDSKVTIPAHPSIDANGKTGLSIVALINPASDGEGDFGNIVSKIDTPGYNFAVTGDAGGFVGLSTVLRMTGDNITTQKNLIVPKNQWSHVATVWFEGGIKKGKLYLNSVLLTALDVDGTGTGNPSDDSAIDLVIGNSAADDRTFDGYIGIVMIYDRALKGAEVAFLSQNPYGLFEKFEV